MATKSKRRPVHPGEILREDVVKPLGLTQEQFAAALGKSPSHVGLILRERRPVTVNMANRLERALGPSAQMWLRLQNNYDLHEAARKYGREYGRIRPRPGASRLDVARAACEA